MHHNTFKFSSALKVSSGGFHFLLWRFVSCPERRHGVVLFTGPYFALLSGDRCLVLRYPSETVAGCWPSVC
ncbi:hypothetical protein V5799_018210 [Amblyomma americanum]|uniref:Uncharacterized protein n=1 Tax=Amblyomma americanum TaxID=6943 RepID=A0AAQ4F0G7_AMBAM